MNYTDRLRHLEQYLKYKSIFRTEKKLSCLLALLFIIILIVALCSCTKNLYSPYPHASDEMFQRDHIHNYIKEP
jgi:hypothetical protein